ncbi:MAG: PDZ domain-containing protein [Bacteroidetes bacterium]|nr:PDZ domain-containing protein [Bacteroidota bacterium]
MLRKIHIPLILSIIIIISTGFLSAEERPLLRFPDIHENDVVFVHADDIWIAPIAGGVATRLTISDGQERYPKFSPDGSMIAFTGNYDGNDDVYVMNKYGGEITRLTFHPSEDQVVGWHPTKNKIMFISSRDHFRFSQLYLISPDGSGLEKMLFHNIANSSFSPDGKKIAYNKVAREGRTWKRYKGGLQQDIYLYDFETNTEKKLTDYEGTDRFPMWIGDKIYFTSDRTGQLNVFSLHPVTGATEQITNHNYYDARFPDYSKDKIIYEQGGELWVLDINSKETKRIDIEIKADNPEVRPTLVDVTDLIQGIDISPTGKRALVVARGDIFTIPKADGTAKNLTESSGARDKDAAWSPDGKSIASISDKSGEYEIYLTDPEGKTESVKLTEHKDGYRHTLRWSPNSKMIGFTDNNLTLYILDISTKKITRVDKAEYENIDVSLDVKPVYDYNWSPDSKYIVYSMMNENLVYQMHIYDLKKMKIHDVSDGLFNDFHPVFSKDGKRLFFISKRSFDPTFDEFEWEMVYNKTAGIYSINLQKETSSLFPLKSDEEGITEKKADKNETAAAIDFDGIADRVEAFPLPRGNYRNLSVCESSLYYTNGDEGDYNIFEFRLPTSMDLFAFDFNTEHERSIIRGISEYKLSFDGSSIVYRKGRSVGILSSSANGSEGNDLNLSGLKMWLNPLEEWTQIFNESWRMERDFYYEPGMHKLDWDAMKVKYGALVPSISCRSDLKYIIGELIGELNTSHTYVFGGDYRRNPEHVNVGMLGADYEVDANNNLYRFKKILRVNGWTDKIYPPLDRPGMNVKEGDFILAVNGKEITAEKEIYSYFQNLANTQVTLLINDKPTKKGAREIVVKTERGERNMRYLDWVENNRLAVDKASNGQIGYIHMPDTFEGSAREFPKYFLGQTRKKGIILDGRFNAGGLDPSIFLQRLNKRPYSYWTRRYSHDQIVPNYAVNSHMVCLTNRQAGSGGDSLPWEFRKFGMGPVIGTTSWGGLVGVSMFLTMIDGGGLSAPDYRIYDTDGSWVVENEGVTPDIIIDLDPYEMYQGKDAQLMKGVEELLKTIKEDPRPWPQHEDFPKDNLR